MINRVILCGRVSEYGPKISWTPQGKAQAEFTLIVPKGEFRTYVPILVVGAKAEETAEQLEPHELVMLEGSLSWKAGRTKEAGKLQVVCFEVLRLPGASAAHAPGELFGAAS
jgi:single-stranded DNA-binding protein